MVNQWVFNTSLNMIYMNSSFCEISDLFMSQGHLHCIAQEKPIKLNGDNWQKVGKKRSEINSPAFNKMRLVRGLNLKTI